MGLIRNGIDTLLRLEEFIGSERKTMRFCALLSLVATVILYTIPYICGWMMDWMIDTLTQGGVIDIAAVLDMCTIIILMIILWYISTAHATSKMSKLSLTFARNLRERINDKLMRVPISYIDTLPPGDLSSRFTSDMPKVSKLISTDYTGFIVHITMILAIAVMMLVTSPVLAAFYLLLTPVVFFASKRLTKQSMEDYEEQRKRVAEINSKMSDIIAAHRTIKVENLQEQVLAEFEESNRGFSNAFISSNTRSSYISPIVSMMVNSGYLTTVIIGAVLLYYGSLDIGMFLTFMIYVRVVNTPLLMTVTIYDSVKDEMISVRRIIEILDAPEEEKPEPSSGYGIEHGEVEFDDVCFSYVEGKPILRNLSFTVHPGKFTVIAGPTASGKSTTANILMGLYKPDSGHVRIDGVDIGRIRGETTGRDICYVMQYPWIIEGSIRENIIYNRPDLTEEEMIKVAEKTGLNIYVGTLPNGYDTIVGEDVHRIPLAQRRMLSMSRALISNPKILVLDETVAGLDPITGQSIIDQIQDLKKDRTIIMISHNQAVINQADEVIYLSNGSVLV